MPDFVVDSILVAMAIAVAIAIGLVLLDRFATDFYVRSALPETPHQGVPRRGGGRRLAVGVAVLVVVVLAGAGIAVARVTSDPLRAAGPATGSGALYLGTAPATYGGTDDVVFSAAPGGDIRLEFSLENTAEFPLTITGLNEPLNGSPIWQEDGYFESGSLVPAGQGSDGAFRRFEIQAHASVRVVARLHLRQCVASAPGPTLAPGQSPSAWAAVAAQGGGFTSFANLTIAYEMLGLTRTSAVALPASLVLINANSVICNATGSPTPAT
jgi:hypothetical protein